MITIHYDDAGMVSHFQGVLEQARRPRAILAAVGREAGNQLKNHFRDKDHANVNRLAPDRREHFWQQVGRSVSAPVIDDGNARVLITISDPRFAQKVFGGPIEAKRAHNLALPVAPDAYGRAPAVFEQETGLKLVFVKQNEHALLAAKVGNHLTVEYLLTPKVDQQKDPTATPDKMKFQAALTDRADKELARQLNDGGSK